MRIRRVSAAGLVLALVAAGCSGSDSSTSANPTGATAKSDPVSTATASTESGVPSDSTPTSSSAPPLGDPKDCPLGALDAASGKVTIKFWYDYDGKRGEEFKALVAAFNASQNKVAIDASFHGNPASFSAIADDFVLAAGSGAGPDLISVNGGNTQLMLDSHTTVPMGACVTADKADISDFLPAIRSTGMSGDTMVSMPWGASGFVLFYNKAAFTKAGLDPDKPPSNLAEIRADSKTIMQAGAAKHGISMIALSAFMKGMITTNGDAWYAASGSDGRADHVVAGGAAGQKLLSQLQDMVTTGELIAYPPGPNPDALLAIASGDSAMAIAPAGQLGDVLKAIADGGAAGVVGGVGPLPTIDKPTMANYEGAGSPLWIAKGTDPAKREAAYRFAKWLVEPEQIYQWVTATGCFPIRTSAADLPAMQQFYAANPQFKVAYDQASKSPLGPLAPRTGATDVMPIFDDMFAAVLTKGADPSKELAAAITKADASLAAYNASVTTSG